MANHHATYAIDIIDHKLPSDTRKTYDVIFFGDTIFTTVTHDPAVAAAWISQIESFHSQSLHRLIVGLDVEWRPSYSQNRNPVATLQLCVDRRCLIYQLIYSPYVPKCLVDFLANPSYTFVGVGVKEDVEKLKEDYNEFGFNTNVADLRGLAAAEYGRRELNNAGVKELVRVVLGKEMEKPKWVTMSTWDNQWLYPDQVQYACIDAFVSFEIGRILNASATASASASRQLKLEGFVKCDQLEDEFDDHWIAPRYVVPGGRGTSSGGAGSVTYAGPSVDTSSSTLDNNRTSAFVAGIATFAAAAAAGLYWLSSKDKPRDEED